MLYGCEGDPGIHGMLKTHALSDKSFRGFTRALDRAGMQPRDKRLAAALVKKLAVTRKEREDIETAYREVFFQWNATAQTARDFEDYVREVVGQEAWTALLRNWMPYVLGKADAGTIRSEFSEALASGPGAPDAASDKA